MMRRTLSELLKLYLQRAGLSVGRVASQVGIPKQTLFNWCSGRTPRWHPHLTDDLGRLARALGLSEREADELLLAAGCIFAMETPELDGEGTAGLPMPQGWFRAGSHPDQYEMGLDPSHTEQAGGAALVRSRRLSVEGFGTLMQTCKPGEYLGERVRLSALARTEEVEDWAGLWFRVDGPGRDSLSFDNMQDRPLAGTCDWERHAIVLDVPKESVGLAYGVLLSGLGCVWIRDMRIEVIDPDTPSTNQKNERPDAPVNLCFRD